MSSGVVLTLLTYLGAELRQRLALHDGHWRGGGDGPLRLLGDDELEVGEEVRRAESVAALAPRRLEILPREADDTDADLLLELGDLARLGELLQRLVDRV